MPRRRVPKVAESLDRVRADLRLLEKLRAGELAVQPDLPVMGRRTAKGWPVGEQALELGRVQVFGPQAVAVWLPFLE